MQLVQIGQVRGKTILQLIEEMAAIQSAEIERLKQSALARQANSKIRTHRGSRAITRPRPMAVVKAA